MPNLRITFSGLCSFAFDQPLKGQGPKPSEATVLLQRLTRARLLSNIATTVPEILDQHFPLLELNLADYDSGSTRLADVHCTPGADGKMTKGVCLLNGEDLSILVDGQRLARNSLDLSRDEPSKKDSPNLNKQERDSLFWMATMDDVFPGRAKINPLVLNTPPASNQPILARILLSEGRLRTLELTDFPCTIVPPPSLGPEFNQRVATTFEFAIPFDSKVTLKSRAIRNGRTSESDLILRSSGGGDVQVGIMNIEINRFVGLDPANGPTAEADFGVFAELLETPISGAIPFLRQTSPGDPAGAPLSTCVPAGGGVH